MSFIDFVLVAVGVWALLDIAGHLRDLSDTLEQLLEDDC